MSHVLGDEPRRPISASNSEAVQAALTCIFNKRAPIVLGVAVQEGVLRTGTPLCCWRKDRHEPVTASAAIDLGKVVSMECERRLVHEAQAGQKVAVKVEPQNAEQQACQYGRHFDHSHELLSVVSRESIDALKAHFRDELSRDDWRLLAELKRVFHVP